MYCGVPTTEPKVVNVELAGVAEPMAREAMQRHVLATERTIRRAMIDFSAQPGAGAEGSEADEVGATAAPGVVIGAAGGEGGG